MLIPAPLKIVGEATYGGFVLAAQFQLVVAIELKEILAIAMGSQCFDTVSVDDRRAVNPHEYRRIEKFFETLHGAAKNEYLTIDMHTHVVAGRIHPIDRIDVDAICLPAVLNGESPRKPRLILGCFDKRIIKRQFLPCELADKLQKLRSVCVGFTIIQRNSSAGAKFVGTTTNDPNALKSVHSRRFVGPAGEPSQPSNRIVAGSPEISPKAIFAILPGASMVIS